MKFALKAPRPFRQRDRNLPRAGVRTVFRGRVFLWIFNLLALTGLLAGILGYLSLRSYLRSDQFRQAVTIDLVRETQAAVDLAPLSWSGWTVRTPSLVIRDTNEAARTELDGISVKVAPTAVLNGTYEVSRAVVERTQVMLDLTRERGPAPEVPEREKTWYSKYLPGDFRLGALDLSSVQVDLFTEEGRFSLQGATASLAGESQTGRLEVEVVGGRLQIPVEELSQIQLTGARGYLQGEELHLTESEFQFMELGEGAVSGVFRGDDLSFQLNGRVNHLQLASFAKKDWQKKAGGELSAQFQAVREPEGEIVVTGKAQIREMKLVPLPVLEKIARRAKSSRLLKTELEDLSCNFRFWPETRTLELSKIQVVAGTLAQVVGSLTVRDREIIASDLELGVSPAALNRLPGAKKEVFQRGERGLLWTPVVVSGTLDRPTEDLSRRLMAAAGKRIFDLLPGRKILGGLLDGKVEELLERE